jgi:pimeloyl-ACP methyl ester carboxylesterase
LRILAIFAALVLAGLVFEAGGLYWDRRRLAPPGSILRAGNWRIHVNDQGSGTPAVIFESGIAASSLSWTLVQPAIAKLTRSVSYDRLGLGWSGKCPVPRSLDAMLSEFQEMLAAAAIPPPYILVGHSFGGLLIRAWAARKPETVSALLFVDPVSLEFWGRCSPEDSRRLSFGVSLARRGSLLARFGVVRLALLVLAAGGRRFPKVVGRAAAGRAAGVLERIVGQIRKLPPEVWPLIRSHWSRAHSMEALAAYLTCLPEAARRALETPIPAKIPFLVLSASNATPGELAEREGWVAANDHAIHEIVPDTGHWIPIERPDAVIAALKRLLAPTTRENDF